MSELEIAKGSVGERSTENEQSGAQASANAPHPKSAWPKRLAIFRSAPTLLVFAMLVAVAWFGNQTGWKLPKFSALTGTEPAQAEPWCDEHNVPEQICIACNAELMPKGQLYGWCREHGVHECVLHNPQLAQVEVAASDLQADLERSRLALAISPRTTNNSACQLHLRRIQFPSIEAVDRAGLEIALVQRRLVQESIKTTGEIVYDPARVTHLTPRTSGTIKTVRRGLGKRVRAGEVVALIDAKAIGQAKSELLRAIIQSELESKNVDRLKVLDGAVAGHRLLDAQTRFAESEVDVQKAVDELKNLGLEFDPRELMELAVEKRHDAVRYLGISDEARESLDPAFEPANLVPINAPREGLIVAQHAVEGEVVGSESMIFTIADTSVMGLQLAVRLEDANRISVGQPLAFRPDGANTDSAGTITWISTDVDEQTRTVAVRGELNNSHGQLRNRTFGAGEILLRTEPEAIVIPNEAAYWEGCCNIAFVRDKDYFREGSYKVFHTRSIRLGVTQDGFTEVIAGLVPGEVVVAKGGAVLRAELLKGNLGAG